MATNPLRVVFIAYNMQFVDGFWRSFEELNLVIAELRVTNGMVSRIMDKIVKAGQEAGRRRVDEQVREFHNACNFRIKLWLVPLLQNRLCPLYNILWLLLIVESTVGMHLPRVILILT